MKREAIIIKGAKKHNPDVIKTADYIIDLGPEGGEEGDFIVTSGTPEKVARKKESYTGQLLKKILACPVRDI